MNTNNDTSNLGNENIPQLTSLRFFLAAWVVIYHIYGLTTQVPLTQFHQNNLISSFFERGYLAVDLFFILSGFIINHCYFNKFNRYKNFDSSLKTYIRFIVARFSRIYPVHILTYLPLLVNYTIMFFLHPENPNETGHKALQLIPILSEISLTQVWPFINVLPLNVVVWSLSAEWFAYISYPFYLLLYRHFNQKKLINLIILCIIMLLFFSLYFIMQPLFDLKLLDCFRTNQQLTTEFISFAITRVVIGFNIGIVLNILFHNHIKKSLINFDIFFIIYVFIFLTLLFMDLPDTVIVILGGIGILLLALSQNLLKHPLLILGGEISFSLYMVHQLILKFLFKAVDLLSLEQFIPVPNQNFIFWFIFSILITLAMILPAYIIYRFIEVPARQYLKVKLGTLVK